MMTDWVADLSAHAPVSYDDYEKRYHFSGSPISDDGTLDKGKAPVNRDFLKKISNEVHFSSRKLREPGSFLK
jgi:hypothetical protein